MRQTLFLYTIACLLFFTGCQPQQTEQLAADNQPTLAPTIIPTPTLIAESATAIPPTATVASPTPLPTQTPEPTATPTVTPTPTPAAPPFTGDRPIDQNLIGIQVHPFGEDQALMLDQLEALGVGWVKIQVSWKLFQPGPDRLDDFWFGETDRFIAGANDRGIKVMVGIAKAPEWSRPTTEEDGPPADFENFTAFTRLLAERYNGQVAAYELWNEPNLRREWNGVPLNGAELTRLIAAGADGIRQVDPSVILISGAPAPTGINDGVNAVDDRVYFEQMLAAGVAQHVDVIGYHPYGASNPVWAQMGDTADYAISHNDHPSFFFGATTEDYLTLLEKYGVEKQLWGTEFGWGTFEQLSKTAPAGAEFMDQLNEWEQAVHIIDAYIYANERPEVGPLILWNLNFGPLLGADFAETGYSILRPDGSQRPAFYAVQQMPKVVSAE